MRFTCVAESGDYKDSASGCRDQLPDTQIIDVPLSKNLTWATSHPRPCRGFACVALRSALWTAARTKESHAFSQVTVHVPPRPRLEGGGGVARISKLLEEIYDARDQFGAFRWPLWVEVRDFSSEVVPSGPSFLGLRDGGTNAFLGAPWQNFSRPAKFFGRA